jgi:transcriptional regulator with XRE-family HTH domain
MGIEMELFAILSSWILFGLMGAFFSNCYHGVGFRFERYEKNITLLGPIGLLYVSLVEGTQYMSGTLVKKESQKDYDFSDEDFKNEVLRALKGNEINARKIANKLEVSVLTVLRWANGAARPSPRIRANIVKQLREMK